MRSRSKETSSELTAILASRYWRGDEAERILAAWRHSGGTLAAFARAHGLSPVRLARWRDRLQRSARPIFHPVRVITGPRRRPVREVAPAPLELVVGDHRIMIRAGFDAELLAELVRVVEGWRC